MTAARFEVAYSSADELLTAFDGEMANGGLLIRGASNPSVQPGDPCTVTVRFGADELELDATVAMVRRFGISLAFDGVPGELELLADRVRSGESNPPVDPPPAEPPSATEPAVATDPNRPPGHGTTAQKLAELTVTQKLGLALHADRETRAYLLRDLNKTVHVYVLKNPRIGLDEVQWAAKQTGLSPDALKMIAEHPDWGHNAAVCAALVRNPRTPLPIAARLLPRLSATDLKAVAKGGARDQLVHAARKLVHT